MKLAAAFRRRTLRNASGKKTKKRGLLIWGPYSAGAFRADGKKQQAPEPLFEAEAEILDSLESGQFFGEANES